MTTTHDLKTWPEYFHQILARKKTFELRLNDRDFQVGDTLRLIEFDPCRVCTGRGKRWVHPAELSRGGTPPDCVDCKGNGGQFTGQALLFTASYVLTKHEGLHQGYALIGLEEMRATGEALVKQPTEATRDMMSAALFRMGEWIAKGGRLVQGQAKAGNPNADPKLLRIQMDMTIERPESETPRILVS